MLLIFCRSISCIVNGSKFPACISSNNQQYMTRPALFGLNLYKYNQGFCYYSFMVILDRCNRICNTLDNPSNKICVPKQKRRCKFQCF